jgi:hypothetical protein
MKIVRACLSIFLGLAGAYALLDLISNWSFIGLDRAIYGAKIKNRKIIFEYDPERDFHGDGYSLKIESADKDGFGKFIEAVRKNKYPSRHYHLGEFEIRKWKETPVRSKDSLAVWFALNPDTIWWDDTTKRFSQRPYDSVVSELKKVKSLVASGKSYYALYFRDHPHRLYGVDLYLVNPETGFIVTINRQ